MWLTTQENFSKDKKFASPFILWKIYSFNNVGKISTWVSGFRVYRVPTEILRFKPLALGSHPRAHYHGARQGTSVITYKDRYDSNIY